VIAEGPKKSEPSTKVAIDESLISPTGWMTLDPVPYLKSIRAATDAGKPAVDTSSHDVLDLSVADMAAARLTRSLRARRPKVGRFPSSGSGGRYCIPASDVVAIGGGDLRRRSPDQPFPDEAELANDNLGRFMVLLILLMAVAGGFFYSTLSTDDRRAIEVTPPDSPDIRITALERIPGEG